MRPTTILLLGLAMGFLSTTGADEMMGDGDDKVIIQSLVQNRAKIVRDVTETAEGVSTYTRSSDPEVAGWIKTHVAAMKKRVEDNNPIRTGDPLFAAVFENAAALELEVTEETDGVRVKETATSSCPIALIKAHAKVVTAFIALGPAETSSKHDVPSECASTAGASTDQTGAATDSGTAASTESTDPGTGAESPAATPTGSAPATASESTDVGANVDQAGTKTDSGVATISGTAAGSGGSTAGMGGSTAGMGGSAAGMGGSTAGMGGQGNGQNNGAARQAVAGGALWLSALAVSVAVLRAR